VERYETSENRVYRENPTSAMAAALRLRMSNLAFSFLEN
jgi:hypothetical protein